jgi:hypothetical protein
MPRDFPCGLQVASAAESTAYRKDAPGAHFLTGRGGSGSRYALEQVRGVASLTTLCTRRRSWDAITAKATVRPELPVAQFTRACARERCVWRASRWMRQSRPDTGCTGSRVPARRVRSAARASGVRGHLRGRPHSPAGARVAVRSAVHDLGEPLQVERPAAGRGDGIALPLPALAVALEVAMLQLHARPLRRL